MFSGQVESQSEKNGSDPHHCFLVYSPHGVVTPQQCFGSWSGWIRIQFETGSGSVFGIRIQMSKIRSKKPKFTMTDFKDKNRKMLWLSWNFNHSFLSLFQELITWGNFILSRTVKKLSHRMEMFCWLCYCITLSHYKSTTRRKSDFLPIKN